LARLSQRPQQTPGEFGTQYFGDARGKAKLAERVREILAEHLELPLAGVTAEDRPVQDLMMDDLDSLSVVEFVVQIEKEFKIDLAAKDAEGLRSLREIVEYLYVRLGEEGADSPKDSRA
jgi:acyl carrier protein